MSETPAEIIRRAAALMREQHGPGHPRHDFWRALAGLLEGEALAAELLGNSLEGTTFDVLKVALAYLGEPT
jgi:hypothetical protein